MDTRTWFVLYVKAQKEVMVATTLAKLGLEVYCPVTKEIRQWSDRKKTIEAPLFKSYVFVRLDEADRNLVFEVPHVVRYLFWLGKPAVVRSSEIETIKSWLSDDSVDEVVLERYNSGQEITITKGVLQNRQATIQKIDGKRMRLILKDIGMVVCAKTKNVL